MQQSKTYEDFCQRLWPIGRIQTVVSLFPPLSSTEQQGGALYFILNMLRAGGYEVSFNLYNSANFGAPQVRERVVVLCSRDGQRLPYLSPTHSRDGQFRLKPWRTFRDVTATLPKIPCDYVHFPEKRLRFYQMLKDGQNWRKLPEALQQEASCNRFRGRGKTGFLRRLAWDKPSPTWLRIRQCRLRIWPTL
jgi:DNA (cytosine-5)-methyltransferase 1